MLKMILFAKEKKDTDVENKYMNTKSNVNLTQKHSHRHTQNVVLTDTQILHDWWSWHKIIHPSR